MSFRERIWPVLGILVGLAFALEGVFGVSKMVFTVTGVIVGAAFALAALLLPRRK